MASRSTHSSDIHIDQIFYVPEGFVGVEQNDKKSTSAPLEGVEDIVNPAGQDMYAVSDEVSADDYSAESYDTDPTAVFQEGYEDGLYPPDIIGVVSQVVRQTSAGNQVVDVVIEVEDMPNALNYELRVTKI